MGRTAKFFITLVLVFNALNSHADAIMRSEAMTATSIAEYFITDEGVRVELEIGLEALPYFRNLMPEAIYLELGGEPRPIEERLGDFFERDFAIIYEGNALPGGATAMGPDRRVLRDPINGTPLPVQDEAPDVIRATLVYPFPEGELPEQLGFTSPTGTDIGFVAYHKGVTVNDFRYLAPGYVLDLDWQDPWYSAFNAYQLKRQYSAPMSGFIYVENFEVRKEIIVRPKDMQRFVDLGLEGRQDIPVAMQADVKARIAEFLATHQPVTIDGEARTGELDRINFLERTLTSSRVVDPPRDLDIDSAIVGAIFVYPQEGLPQNVVMAWDLWDERITRIPVSSVDQAGPLPSYLERAWPDLEWKNFLKNPDIPVLQAIEAPVEDWRVWLGRLLPAFALLAALGLLWLWRARQGGRAIAAPVLMLLLAVAATLAARHYGADNRPEGERASLIVATLLENIYHAFEYREESDIYDKLDYSVSGELLTDIFLETKRSLVLANQGGAEAKVKDISINAVESTNTGDQGSFEVRADWTVNGSVGHWGHVHKRSNRYEALLTIAIDEGRWKLQNMNVLQEERL